MAKFKDEPNQAELERLREVLRRHVMDWGECDHPDDCDCSHAVALRALQEVPF